MHCHCGIVGGTLTLEECDDKALVIIYLFLCGNNADLDAVTFSQGGTRAECGPARPVRRKSIESIPFPVDAPYSTLALFKRQVFALASN